MHVIGQGGASAFSDQIGVLVEGGRISSGGGTDLLLQGTGGALADWRGHGVSVLNNTVGLIGTGTISTTGGNTRIVGVPPLADFENRGVSFEYNTLISVGNTGSLTIEGTAGQNTLVVDPENDGIRLYGNLASTGANVSLIGRGGGGTDSEGLEWDSSSAQLGPAASLRIEAGATAGASASTSRRYRHCRLLPCRSYRAASIRSSASPPTLPPLLAAPCRFP